MTRADVFAVAQAFDADVIARFRAHGWHACSFGQGLLPPAICDCLQHFEDHARRPSLVRWFPDVIAGYTVAPWRSVVAAIDAKTCGPDRANYAIEVAALDVAEHFADRLYTPMFFVFDDWQVLTPRDVRQRGRQGPDPVNGSGTPYVLVAKRYGRAFDSVFRKVTT
jgi:hypothetical protein